MERLPHLQRPYARSSSRDGSGRTVSAMPNTLIPGEVSAWVEECHALMLDAVNVGDRNQGVVEIDRRGSGASDQVDQSTALSCVCERIHSRYGLSLRGVPGPDCCADILRIHDISSDEEPLIPSGRNVVSRLSGVQSVQSTVPVTVSEVGRHGSSAVTPCVPTG